MSPPPQAAARLWRAVRCQILGRQRRTSCQGQAVRSLFSAGSGVRRQSPPRISLRRFAVEIAWSGDWRK